MRCAVVVLICLFSVSAFSQSSQHAGLGTYVNASLVKYRSVSSGVVIHKQAFNTSPYLFYRYNPGLFMLSFGVGYWKNVDSWRSLDNDSYKALDDFRSVYHYVFVPVSVGINPINQKLKIGVHADAHYRNLLVRIDKWSEETYWITSPHKVSRDEMLKDGGSITAIAVGGGAHLSCEFARFTPMLQVGYLQDLADTYPRGTFTNVYANASLSYRFRETRSY